jgi:hypothetical protein
MLCKIIQVVFWSGDKVWPRTHAFKLYYPIQVHNWLGGGICLHTKNGGHCSTHHWDACLAN